MRTTAQTRIEPQDVARVRLNVSARQVGTHGVLTLGDYADASLTFTDAATVRTLAARLEDLATLMDAGEPAYRDFQFPAVTAGA